MSVKPNPKYGQPDERDPTSLCNAMDVRVLHSKIDFKVNLGESDRQRWSLQQSEERESEEFIVGYA